MKSADRDNSAKFVFDPRVASSELRVVRAYLYEVSTLKRNLFPAHTMHLSILTAV
jgi:hypothetical protein